MYIRLDGFHRGRRRSGFRFGTGGGQRQRSGPHTPPDKDGSGGAQLGLLSSIHIHTHICIYVELIYIYICRASMLTSVRVGQPAFLLGSNNQPGGPTGDAPNHNSPNGPQS